MQKLQRRGFIAGLLAAPLALLGFKKVEASPFPHIGDPWIEYDPPINYKEISQRKDIIKETMVQIPSESDFTYMSGAINTIEGGYEEIYTLHGGNTSLWWWANKCGTWRDGLQCINVGFTIIPELCGVKGLRIKLIWKIPTTTVQWGSLSDFKKTYRYGIVIPELRDDTAIKRLAEGVDVR